MACKLVYNNEGQFVKALTPDGRESSLFKQILSIPHIRSVKEASELYANIFSKKMYFIMGEKGAKRLDNFYKNQDKSISLVKAKEMKESSDFSDKDIKIQTNWELGADGMWRYEVPPILDIKEKLRKLYIEAADPSANFDTVYERIQNILKEIATQ